MAHPEERNRHLGPSSQQFREGFCPACDDRAAGGPGGRPCPAAAGPAGILMALAPMSASGTSGPHVLGVCIPCGSIPPGRKGL